MPTVQAVLHRYGGSAAVTGPASYGGHRLQIDDSAHQAWLDGAALELTPTEWGVLAALANRGEPRRHGRCDIPPRARNDDRHSVARGEPVGLITLRPSAPDRLSGLRTPWAVAGA